MVHRELWCELFLPEICGLELCDRLRPSHISRTKPLNQISRLDRLKEVTGKIRIDLLVEENLTLEHRFAAVDVYGLTSYETRLL